VALLRNAYRQLLNRRDCDPLALHEACLRGELFEYVGQEPVSTWEDREPYPQAHSINPTLHQPDFEEPPSYEKPLDRHEYTHRGGPSHLQGPLRLEEAAHIEGPLAPEYPALLDDPSIPEGPSVRKESPFCEVTPDELPESSSPRLPSHEANLSQTLSTLVLMGGMAVFLYSRFSRP
jgi:hypothetical protein